MMALDGIALRRDALKNSKTSMTIKVETPDGNIHLRCKAIIKGGSHWRLEISGPLGVDLAAIEMKGDRYAIKDIQHSDSREGFIDEPLFLPNLSFELPAMRYLAPILLPFPDITYPQDWTIVQANVGDSGDLRLKHTIPSELKQMELTLDYNPLRVLTEVSHFGNLDPVSRTFSYKDQKSLLPKSVLIRFNELTFNIVYNSIVIQKSIGDPSSSMPL